MPYPAAWESLVGAKLSDPEGFIPRLLGQQRGRLAYCLDTVTDLEPRRRQYLLGPPSQDREDGERRVRALARLCASFRPEWDASSQPFSRPAINLASVARQIALDREGRFAGPKTEAFWSRVFAGGPPPKSRAKWTEQVTDSDRASAEWLLRKVLDVDPATSHERLRAILFAQRHV